MFDVKKEYVVTEENKKKAVLIDIETFEKIEKILESYGLGKYMEEIEGEETMPLKEDEGISRLLSNKDRRLSSRM